MKDVPSVPEFLAWLPHGQAACLVLDVHMDELSGPDHGSYRDEGGEA